MPSLSVTGSLVALSIVSAAAAQDESYAPTSASCPDDVQLFRPANGLNPLEAQWVQGRKRVVYDAFAAYVKRLNLEDFDADDYLCRLRDSNYEHVPVMSFSVSGGGAASAYTGLGGNTALDARNPAAIQQRTGGLLQSLTYYTGQSGGTWPTMGLPFDGFPTADQLAQDWRTSDNFYGNTTLQNETIMHIGEKFEAGFNVSFSDFYGIVMATQYTVGHALNTYSSLTEAPLFLNHSIPMPFYQISEITPGDQILYDFYVPSHNGSATQYEVTPFEFGAWGGVNQPSGFTPTKYLGTDLNNGSAAGNNCVTGFDRLGFMLGSSATAMNFWNIEYLSNNTLGLFPKRAPSIGKREPQSSAPPSGSDLAQQYALDQELYGVFEELFGLDENSTTYGIWPNPFRGLADQPAYHREADQLALVDDTEVGSALPLWGLMQPERQTDFMMVWDDDEDTDYSWNNGTNLRNLYEQASAAGVPVAKIPTVETIINRGYHLRPTLFGCDANMTTDATAPPAVLAYFANAPYSAYTNFSYAQVSFEPKQMAEILTNSFNLVTLGNGTLDAEWPACLGCAAIERSRDRVGIARSAQCERCFAKYCWDGTEDDITDAQVVDPEMKLDPGVSFEQWLANGNPF